MSNKSLTTIAATTIPPKTGTAGGVTSFSPLTTPFTANKVCSDLFVKYANDHHGLMGWDPSYGEKVDGLYSCNPELVTRWFSQSTDGGIGPGQTGFSMGPFSCPSGWNTVASAITSFSSTRAECCPPSYSLVDNPSGSVEGNCMMAVTPGQTLTYASAISGSSSYGTFITTMNSHSTVGAIAITGWNVNYVRSVAPTSPSASIDTSSAATIPSTENRGSSALSGGAIAGIVIGVIVGISFIAIGLVLFTSKRRKQHQRIASGTNSMPVEQDLQAELPGQGLPYEMDEAHMVSELPTESERPHELDVQAEEKKDSD